MKIKLITLIAVGLVLFSSCTKEDERVDPVLEIFVTTKASQNWGMVNMNASQVRFAIGDETGGQGWGSLQQYYGVDYQVSLQQDNSILIFNDRHFDIEKLLGLRLMMGNIFLSNNETGDALIKQPWFTYIELDETVSLENGKSYKIEFILDFDKLIYEENGNYFLDNKYEVEVTEL